MKEQVTTTLSLPLRAVMILAIALILAVPMTLSPLGTPEAHATILDVDTGGGDNSSGGGGSGGSGVEGPPPKDKPYNPGTPKPGNPNKGGGHSTYGPYISDIEGTGMHATATYVTKQYFSGVVDFRTGRNDAKGAKDQIRQLAYAKCRLAPWVNGTREYVGARIGMNVTTTRVHQYHKGIKGKLLKTTHKYAASSANCLTLDFTIRDLRCYVDANGGIRMVTPSSSTLKTASKKTPYGNGNKSYVGCMNSQSISLSVNTKLSKFGRYEAWAKHRYQNIKVKIPTKADPVTGKWPATTVVSRSGLINSTTNYSYAQLTCRGAEVGRTKAVWKGSPKWDYTECGPDSSVGTPIYTCSNVNGTAKINGQSTNSATIFRDGEENSLTFPKVTVKGSGAKVHSTKTKVSRSGTPWNTNGTVNARTNDFQMKANGKGSSVFNSNKGTAWMSGNINSYTFSSVWSSDKGSPTVLKPTYEYDLSLTVPTITITQWNLSTGDVYYTRSTASVRAKAVCEGKPVSIDVVRSKESG